jgi:hypothetical protein
MSQLGHIPNALKPMDLYTFKAILFGLLNTCVCNLVYENFSKFTI